MRVSRSLFLVVALVGAGFGCAPPVDLEEDSAWLDGDPDGKADGVSGMRVSATHLDVDLEGHTAVARITLEHDGNVALEAGGLTVTRVSDDRGPRAYRLRDGALRVSRVHGELVVEYGFAVQTADDGLLAGGSTMLWPYFCGNVFPCHSQPDDGMRFSLAIDGAPQDEISIYPSSVSAEAPSYMLAWATGKYAHLDLGTTSAGTRVGVDWLPGGEHAARSGTANLVGIFDWLETRIGPYLYGDEVRSVSVRWTEGAYGGSEHHPYWHMAENAMDDEVTQAHEAAHGWFGNAIRLRCWEDFVLSDGTVTYLAARSIGQVRGAAAEAEVWSRYESRLAYALTQHGTEAWPTGCNEIDILQDRLFTNIPYMQGAYFYKEVAEAVGAEVLDGVFREFYAAHKGGAAGMQDMIDAIEQATGFDTTALVARRLRAKP